MRPFKATQLAPESAWPMTVPLMVLAVPSVRSAFGYSWNNRFAALLNPAEALELAEHQLGGILPSLALVAISVAGIGLATAATLRKVDLGTAVAGRFRDQRLGQQVVSRCPERKAVRAGRP